MQVGEQLLVDARGVIGRAFAHARGDLAALAIGEGFVVGQQQAQQRGHHRIALFGEVAQGIGMVLAMASARL